MTVYGQSAVNYTWDNANRLTQIAQSSATVTLGYDSANRRTSLTLPNGIAAAYGYDAASNLTSIAYTNGSTAVGNLTYTYDADGRRTSVGGTLTGVNLPAALSSAAYNANNQLTQWGSSSLTYDLDGNLTNDGTNSYSWDARNQLSSVGSSSFAYDSFGRRTQNAAGTGFLYDGVNSVQELSGSTVTANLLGGPWVDEVFTRTDSAGARDFLLDALGSTEALTDSSSTIQTQYTYGPFGSTTSSGSSSANAYQFTGRENDGTGLYYYRARYYSPTTGRILSEDPSGFAGSGPNLYEYAGDNPVNFNDPFGLDRNAPNNPIDDQGSVINSTNNPINSANDPVDAPPNETPGYNNSCITRAIDNGLLHAFIDGIGLIPEGGLVSRAVGNYAGWRGIVATQQGTKTIQAVKMGTGIGSTGVFSNDSSTTGVISTGLGVAGIAAALGGAVPGVGQVISGASIVADIYSAGKEIAGCN
jgi:RHS repeat-associated protein